MPILFGKPESKDSIESLRHLLFDDRSSVSFNADPHNRTGKSSGRLVGGNLSLIVDSMGTATEPDTQGNILVIEEIDEYNYRLDRMLNHLKRAGKLEKLSGLIIGHMTDIKESELPFNESIEQIVTHVVKDYAYPVAFKFPSGHENPNLAWIHGEYYELNVDPSSVILRSRGYAL
jgi:muramoyltetrapeptide carboxypeptidase